MWKYGISVWPVLTVIYIVMNEPHNAFWNVMGVIYWAYIGLALLGLGIAYVRSWRRRGGSV
jgi:hypothetical protein